MKRFAFFRMIGALTAAAVLTAPVAVASARPGSGRGATLSRALGTRAATGSLPRAQLDTFACHKSAQQSERSVSIRAVMRPVPGTKRMEMRFELLSQATRGAASVEMPGIGLQSWISPTDPTLGQRPGDVWLVPDQIRNLPAPADYRYRVSFRWIGTGGQVLASEMRSSQNCHQPAHLPDLVVKSIAIEAVQKATSDNYVATIENDGQAPAVGPFTVTFTPAASLSPGAVPMNSTQTIEQVEVGAAHAVTVTFVGPPCTAANAPTVVVDPEHAVDESDFDNNSLTVDPSCPALTSSPGGAY